jgi:hypothetical protein
MRLHERVGSGLEGGEPIESIINVVAPRLEENIRLSSGTGKEQEYVEYIRNVVPEGHPDRKAWDEMLDGMLERTFSRPIKQETLQTEPEPEPQVEPEPPPPLAEPAPEPVPEPAPSPVAMPSLESTGSYNAPMKDVPEGMFGPQSSMQMVASTPFNAIANVGDFLSGTTALLGGGAYETYRALADMTSAEGRARRWKETSEGYPIVKQGIVPQLLKPIGEDIASDFGLMNRTGHFEPAVPLGPRTQEAVTGGPISEASALEMAMREADRPEAAGIFHEQMGPKNVKWQPGWLENVTGRPLDFLMNALAGVGAAGQGVKLGLKGASLGAGSAAGLSRALGTPYQIPKKAMTLAQRVENAYLSGEATASEYKKMLDLMSVEKPNIPILPGRVQEFLEAVPGKVEKALSTDRAPVHVAGIGMVDRSFSENPLLKAGQLGLEKIGEKTPRLFKKAMYMAGPKPIQNMFGIEIIPDELATDEQFATRFGQTLFWDTRSNEFARHAKDVEEFNSKFAKLDKGQRETFSMVTEGVASYVPKENMKDLMDLHRTWQRLMTNEQELLGMTQMKVDQVAFQPIVSIMKQNQGVPREAIIEVYKRSKYEGGNLEGIEGLKTRMKDPRKLVAKWTLEAKKQHAEDLTYNLRNRMEIGPSTPITNVRIEPLAKAKAIKASEYEIPEDVAAVLPPEYSKGSMLDSRMTGESFRFRADQGAIDVSDEGNISLKFKNVVKKGKNMMVSTDTPERTFRIETALNIKRAPRGMDKASTPQPGEWQDRFGQQMYLGALREAEKRGAKRILSVDASPYALRAQDALAKKGLIAIEELQEPGVMRVIRVNPTQYPDEVVAAMSTEFLPDVTYFPHIDPAHGQVARSLFNTMLQEIKPGFLRGRTGEMNDYMRDPSKVLSIHMAENMRYFTMKHMLESLLPEKGGIGLPLDDPRHVIQAGQKIPGTDIVSKMDYVAIHPEGFLKFYRKSVDIMEELAEAKPNAKLSAELQKKLNAFMEAAPDESLRQSFMMARKGGIVQIPKPVYDSILGEILPEINNPSTNGAMNMYLKLLHDPYTMIFRNSVLGYSPRWVANNVFGNLFLSMMGEIGPMPFAWAESKKWSKAVPEKLLLGGFQRHESLVERAWNEAGVFKPIQALSRVAEEQAKTWHGRLANKLGRVAITGFYEWNSEIEDFFRKAAYLSEARKAVSKQVMKESVGTADQMRSGMELFLGVGRGSSTALYNRIEALNAANPKLVHELMQKAGKVMFQYNNMTNFERRFMRRVFPFWAWYKNVVLFTMGLPGTSPIKTKMLNDLGKVASDVGRMEWEEAIGKDDAKHLPNYIKQAYPYLKIQAKDEKPVQIELTDTGDVVEQNVYRAGSMRALDMKAANVLNTIAGGPGLHPLLVFMWERANGKKWYTDKAFTSPMLVELRGRVYEAVPKSGTWSDLSRGMWGKPLDTPQMKNLPPWYAHMARQFPQVVHGEAVAERIKTGENTRQFDKRGLFEVSPDTMGKSTAQSQDHYPKMASWLGTPIKEFPLQPQRKLSGQSALAGRMIQKRIRLWENARKQANENRTTKP